MRKRTELGTPRGGACCGTRHESIRIDEHPFVLLGRLAHSTRICQQVLVSGATELRASAAHEKQHHTIATWGRVAEVLQ